MTAPPAGDEGGRWFAALLASSFDAVVGVDAAGTVVAWNAPAEQLFERPARDAVGRQVSLLGPDVEALVARALGGDHVEHHDATYVRRDGSTTSTRVTVAPVVAAEGVVVGVVVTAADVSARLHVEATSTRAVAQLERKNEELVRANEELDSFATVASHDLAQPLQVAYGFVEMVRAAYGDTLDDEARAWIDHARGALERMRALVGDILAYARTGRSEDEHAPVPLAGAVRDALDALAVELRDRGAVVDVGELPTVVGDRAQLALVFQNVIGNAVKFVPAERSPRVRVFAEHVEPGPDAVVAVADNGVGIPADQREAAFEMFRRLDATGVPGTGVGLAIVRKIVGRHGGAAWIGEDDRPGTTVYLRLPLAPPGRPD